MKVLISKEKLHDLAAGEWSWQTEYGDEDGIKEATRLCDAIQEDNFEIEGFERVQWTKFDPHNPVTFPKDSERVLVYDADGYVYEVYAWILSGGTKCEFYTGERVQITHWRPLPEPPVNNKKEK